AKTPVKKRLAARLRRCAADASALLGVAERPQEREALLAPFGDQVFGARRQERVDPVPLRDVRDAEAVLARDRPRDRRMQPEQRAEERALAGAVPPDDAPELAPLDGKVDRREDRAPSEADLERTAGNERARTHRARAA